MSRMEELEARRARLIADCERQRAGLSEQFGELRQSPLSRAAGELFTGGFGVPLLRPITWAAALAGLLLLRRPRQVLTLLTYARTALAFGSRAMVALKLIDQFRSRRRREPEAPREA
ncbi:MAG: hypothetical protein JSS29_00630 [Proteobacteria bacterium]|nr:hypothetical protein [Pseudomonadota bacterium]